MNTRALPLTLLAALLLAAAPLQAQSPPPDWNALPEADRAALVAPTAERWQRATSEQRQRMLDRARFWASLTPEQKRMARQGVERFRAANADQRQRLRGVWQQLQALPPDQRAEALRTWRALTPQQRRAWLEAGGPGVAPPPATNR